MYQGERVILIVPFFNEENIGKVIQKAKETVFDEICAVNDGSTDNSLEIAQKEGAIIISHRQRRGVGAAIRSGIKHALENNFDIIVICAGNDKDDPRQVERLLKPIVEQGYDYIQGSRYLKGGGRENMPFYRTIGCPLFALLYSAVVFRKLTDITNGFRAYTTDFIKDSRINIDQEWLDKYDLEYYLHYKSISLGFKMKEVPVTKIYPTKKTTKISPLLSLWIIFKPLILLRLGIKK